MNLIFGCLLAVVFVPCSYSKPKRYFIPYTEDGLPKLYSMENFYDCRQRNGKFCKVDVLIKPKDPNSKLASEIQKSKETKYRYHRSHVYRMLCIPSNTWVREQYAHNVTKEELKDFNVSSEIYDVKCEADISPDWLDLLMGLCVVAYGLLVFKSSYYIYKDKFSRSKYEKWYKIFAIQENWKKLTIENTSEDFRTLKSVQSIRFYNSIMVIICHSQITPLILYVNNPTELEKLVMNPIYNYSLQLDLFIVQTFMMISTFLLTKQIYDIYQKNGHFSLYHCWVLYVNRIFRFFPTVLVMMFVMIPLLKIIQPSPQIMEMVALGYHGCQTGWWAALLQLNFLFIFSEMCMSGTWYISVDTFLYVTAMLILYVKFKWNLDLKGVLAVAFIITAGVFGIIIYINDLNHMYTVNVESCKNVFHSDAFNKLYISPFSSWSTCCVGVAIGTIYYRSKSDKSLKFGKIHTILWALIFFGVPALLVYTVQQDLPHTIAPILGPLLKPAFSLAIGIGILGTTKNIGGVIQKILEWDFAVKMSNFTFCTYLFHFFLVFSRGSFTYDLFEFKPSNLFIYLILDVLVSFAVGIACTVLIEKPGLTLQKMYIPQIKYPKNTADDNKKTN
ncbi:nose resistant to fluoxetine protein 6-like [Cylas formicarius]|uniref:nose resistant to fluoxetine protein 6-like n=1 Tax=Cylas formicarius TaxID=197179 RepID=UPI0029588DF1|nr:nose resistant to fluoxetine protein 6-like [Cylas formicarius]